MNGYIINYIIEYRASDIVRNHIIILSCVHCGDAFGVYSGWD